MSNALIAVFTVLLFADVADAGEILDGIAPPAQACHVRWLFVKGSTAVKNDKGEEEMVFTQSNGCSATVIGKRDVLISASCIPDVEKSGPYTAQVVCDGGKKVLPLKNLPEAFTKHDKSKLALNDIAVLQTKDEIGIDPAKIPVTQAEWEKLFKLGKCVLFGYGEQVKDLEAKPRAIRAYIVAENLARKMNAVGEMPGDKSKMVILTEEKIHPGDTGGGLLCQDEKDGWYAMNVTSYIGQPQIQLGLKKLVWADGKEFATDKPFIGALTSTPVAADWIREKMNPADAMDPAKVFGPAFPEASKPRIGTREKTKRNHE